MPRLTVAAAVLLVLSLAVFAALCLHQRFPMADTLVYRAEGMAVLHGRDLYGFTVTEWELPATYPPFAALLFVPAAWMPPAVLKVLCMPANLALLAWLVHLSLRLAGLPRDPRHRAPALLAGTAVVLWLEPVFQTLVFGQINLLLACLVLWDLGRPHGARGKGLAIGLAAGLKLTPAVFAVHLLVTGRAQAAASALAAFAGTVAAGLLVLPGDTLEFFTRRLFETGRVGKAWIVDNQSLQGLLARAAHTADPGLLWLVPAAVTGVCGLLLARRLHRRGRAAPAVVVTAVTALLVSPISWSHHWVWCVPLLTAAGATALARKGKRWPFAAVAAAVVLFTARTMWLVPKDGALDLRLAWWQQPLASPYPLLGLALLAAAAALPRHSSAASTPDPGDGAASGPAASGPGTADRSEESTIR